MIFLRPVFLRAAGLVLILDSVIRSYVLKSVGRLSQLMTFLVLLYYEF